MEFTLKPAYGRDYNSEEAVLADWNGGKDFIIANVTSQWCGKPISKRDIKLDDNVTFRYAKLRKVFVL